MKNNKGLLILFFAALLYLVFYNNVCISKHKGDYLTELKLILIGEVKTIDMPKNFNGFGIVKAQIINSNITEYNPREDLDYYYCVIRNNQIEAYQYDLSQCEVGDTIVINTITKTFTIKNRDKRIERDIILYTNDRFYKYVRKKHQKF